MFLLGVDLGTTATKAALYDLSGRLVSEGRAEVPFYHPQPGAVEQEMEDFYQSAAVAIRECMSFCNVDLSQVAGMAFDSQMAGVGGIDEFGQPAMRFDSWLDSRCQTYIEEIDRNFGDRVTELTGCPVTCNHAPKMLWWAEERPSAYQRIAKFVMPSSYVAGRAVRLPVEDAYIDPTFLHFTGVSDAVSGTWSEELCSALGVDITRLPRITEPWTVIGELSPESASDFGLMAGIPVAAGCGDTAAGALGAGIVRPGMLLDTAGTASVLACCTDRFVADTRYKALMVMRSVVPGIWNPLAYVGGGGLAPGWFGREFSNCYPEGVTSDEAYTELFAQAADVPAGCDGLQFSPHLGGRVCPAAPEMRGAWIGFSWTHTRKYFLRAILESVGYEYAWYLRILRELAPELKLVEARVIGGGAKSETWNQIKADILSVPYVQLPRRECATWGSALIAGKAAGLISNLAEAATELAPRMETKLSPNPALRVTYDASLERYLYWQLKLKTGFEDHEKIIRVCLVGAGRAGQVHAESLTEHVPGAALVSLVDPDTATLEKAGTRFGVEARFTSLEEAIDKADFDAVIITTPTFTHRDLAVTAAADGKHVFCEKPMALSLEECDEMMAAAERNGVLLQLGFMRRFDADFQAAATRIEAGEIGRPMVVKSLTHGPGLPPPWARDLKTSNGMLAEVNSHDFDSVRWLAHSNPERVYAEVSNFKGEKHGVDTPNFFDTALVNIRFESNALASISGVCPCDYGYDARIEIIGEKGLIQIGDIQGQSVVVCTDRERGIVTPIYRSWPERFGSAYVREMKHFLTCVRTETEPSVGGRDGRWAVAVVLAANQSFLQQRSVRIAEVLEGAAYATEAKA